MPAPTTTTSTVSLRSTSSPVRRDGSSGASHPDESARAEAGRSDIGLIEAVQALEILNAGIGGRAPVDRFALRQHQYEVGQPVGPAQVLLNEHERRPPFGGGQG